MTLTGKSDIEGFVVSDPDGAFLTLSRDEGEQLLVALDDLAQYEELSENLDALRKQLSEFLG